MEYEDYLFIQKDRIGILIGEKGEIKKELEKKTGVKIEIDSKTGEITIERDEKVNPENALKVKNVIKAISRGFSPEKAFKLLEDDYYLRIIDLEELTSTEKQRMRQRARVIGTKGKARKHLEKITGTYISVYGNTVSIIGELEDTELAVQAITKLVKGSPHGRVYRFVERKRFQER